MLDFLSIFAMAWIIQYCVRRHKTGDPIKGIGDLIGLVAAAVLIFGLTKWIVLGLIAGFSFPMIYTSTQGLISSVIVLGLWFPLLYWRPLMFVRQYYEKLRR